MPSPLPRWDRNPSRSVQGCDIGLPRPFVGSAPTSNVSRPARRSLALRPACSRSCPRQPFPSKASAVSLPPLPLRLLPATATRCRVGIAPTENVSLLTTHKGDKSNYCGGESGDRKGKRVLTVCETSFACFSGPAAWSDRQVDMQTPTETIGPRPLSVGQPRLAAAADGGQFRLAARAMHIRRPANHANRLRHFFAGTFAGAAGFAAGAGLAAGFAV